MKKMMGAFKTAVVMIFSIVALLGHNPIVLQASTDLAFSDTKQHWGRDTIAWGVDQRIVQGYENGTFRPDQAVAEPEFLAMLLRAYPVVAVPDVSGSWYDKYYNKAKLMNWPIMYDVNNLKFNRGSVALLVAATQGQHVNTTQAIEYLLSTGLTNGKTSKTVAGFRQEDKITRAESLQFIKNLRDRQVKLVELSQSSSMSPTIQSASDSLQNLLSNVTPTVDLDLQTATNNRFQVAGIIIGDSLNSVIEKLGAPARKDSNAYEFEWYIYNQDYANYMQIGIKDGRVVGLYTNSDTWKDKSGVRFGIDTMTTVMQTLGSPLGYILKGNTQYMINNGKHEYDVYMINGAYTTIFYDILNNNRVTGLLVIEKQVEESSSGYYGMTSAGLTTSYEKEIFDMANVERVRAGKKPFVWDDKAADISRSYSKNMAVSNLFSHTDLSGNQPWDRAKASGLSYTRYAENIASGQSNAIMAHHAWMNSAGHRQNIMGDTLRLGVGVYFGGAQYIYYTQNFYTP